MFFSAVCPLYLPRDPQTRRKFRYSASPRDFNSFFLSLFSSRFGSWDPGCCFFGRRRTEISPLTPPFTFCCCLNFQVVFKFRVYFPGKLGSFLFFRMKFFWRVYKRRISLKTFNSKTIHVEKIL